MQKKSKKNARHNMNITMFIEVSRMTLLNGPVKSGYSLHETYKDGTSSKLAHFETFGKAMRSARQQAWHGPVTLGVVNPDTKKELLSIRFKTIPATPEVTFRDKCPEEWKNYFRKTKLINGVRTWMYAIDGEEYPVSTECADADQISLDDLKQQALAAIDDLNLDHEQQASIKARKKTQTSAAS